jgi:putative peptidoglycan lipid II flippase
MNNLFEIFLKNPVFIFISLICRQYCPSHPANMRSQRQKVSENHLLPPLSPVPIFRYAALMKQTESISAAALLLATGILLSRMLGYVREMLLAWKFGANGVTDAFYAAFQIPDLLNYFLAGGALSIAFIPLYNKILSRDGEAAANALTTTVLGTLGAAATIATALLSWQAPALIHFQFPHFDTPTTELTVKLTRIVLPAQVFFIMGGIIQAVLLARRSFMAAAISPLVYNSFIIAGGYFLYPYCGITGFALGTLAGSIAGPFLIPLLYSYKHIPLRLRFAPFDRNFLIYLALAAPLMFGQTLLTLDEWYGRWFGALLSAGTVAHISYARRLMQVPIAVIGQAVAAAALPTLSRLWAENKVDELNATLLRTLRAGMSLAVLAAAGFYALSGPIVALVYHHGAFNGADAATVSSLVAILSFAIPGWILQQITVRAFYARGDTWRPMALGTILSLLVIPLYIGLTKIGGVEGIAVAGAIGMTLNALATLGFAWKLHGAPACRPLALSFLKTTMIAVTAAGAAMGAMMLREHYLIISSLHIKVNSLIDLTTGGGVFCLVALSGTLSFGDVELQKYVASILRRLRRQAYPC